MDIDKRLQDWAAAQEALKRSPEQPPERPPEALFERLATDMVREAHWQLTSRLVFLCALLAAVLVLLVLYLHERASAQYDINMLSAMLSGGF